MVLKKLSATALSQQFPFLTMMTFNDAREQLLSQIELELCRIYPAGSDAPEKLEEFYDHISELPLSNFIFNWYRVNADKVLIRYIGKEVCIYKADDDDDLPSGYIVGIDGPDALDDLIVPYALRLPIQTSVEI